jgi:preprotein translocase subunit SecF
MQAFAVTNTDPEAHSSTSHELVSSVFFAKRRGATNMGDKSKDKKKEKKREEKKKEQKKEDKKALKKANKKAKEQEKKTKKNKKDKKQSSASVSKVLKKASICILSFLVYVFVYVPFVVFMQRIAHKSFPALFFFFFFI